MAPSRRTFLAGLAACGLLTACSSGTPAPTGPATRTVTHPLGVTEVPTAPTRVLALDRRSTLPHLLALGITPVGALTHSAIIGSDFPSVLGGAADGITVVPTTDGSDVPALESVAALAPDLILGWSTGLEEVYPQLSAIAPTVGVEIDFSDASVALRTIASALGREAEADAVIGGFDAQLATAAAAIGNPGPVTVLLGIGGGQFRVYRPGSVTVARWIVDFGGSVVPDATTLPGDVTEDFTTISPENLALLTGETIVLLANTGPDGEAAVREIETSPLWPSLPAVAAGRVVRVESQSAVGNFGFPGYTSVLGTLTDGWAAMRRA
jgi:iron complex transport system substrate-binding protein